METHIGLLTHTQVFKEKPYAITGMLIWENDKCINCVIKNKVFTSYVLSLTLNKYVVKITGKYNLRNQFEVQNMSILNIDSYIAIIGTPE